MALHVCVRIIRDYLTWPRLCMSLQLKLLRSRSDHMDVVAYSSKTYDANASILDATKLTWSRIDRTYCAYYTHIMHCLDVTTSTWSRLAPCICVYNS